MANQKTESGRLTKAERKEQARRERVELQRKMARARRNRWIALGVTVVVAVAATVFVITRPQDATASTTPQDLLAEADAQNQAAGCGQVQTVKPFQPETSDRAHLVTGQAMPPFSKYSSIPPASGPHNPSPLGPGIYPTPPPMDRVIHSLEHGAAVIWYAPSAAGEDLDRLIAFYKGHAQAASRVLVAPFDYPDQPNGTGELPPGTDMALVAWHHLENCASVNLAAAFDFTARYAAPPSAGQTYLGEAPEAGAQI